MTNYEPTTWEKGGRTKVARSPREAVALKFDGYKQVEQGSSLPDQPVDDQPTAGADADQASEFDYQGEPQAFNETPEGLQ